MDKEISKAELDGLVKEFQAITDEAKKAAFYHANPPLWKLFRAHHFPKPAAEVAAVAVGAVTSEAQV